jgi:hypothetical protein
MKKYSSVAAECRDESGGTIDRVARRRCASPHAIVAAMPTQCSICHAEDASDGFRVGPKCASRLGLRLLPPPRRPAVPCTRCNGMRFVRVLPRQYSTGWMYIDMNTAPIMHSVGVPMTLTATPPPVQKHVIRADTVQEPGPFDGLGTIETFVCCSCGFLEWYCQDPQAMPIGDEYNTQLVDYSSDQPYR